MCHSTNKRTIVKPKGKNISTLLYSWCKQVMPKEKKKLLKDFSAAGLGVSEHVM